MTSVLIIVIFEECQVVLAPAKVGAFFILGQM